MTTIRVTVRCNTSNAIGKVLRFDPSIDFEMLLLKIAQKLGVGQDIVENIRDHFALLLGGKRVLVEDTSEIEAGDDLILQKLNADQQVDDDNNAELNSENIANKNNNISQPDNVVSQDTSSNDSDNHHHDNDTTSHKEEREKSSESDDCSVEDVTEENLKKKAKEKEDKAINLSSDEEENSENYEEGSVAEGSDAWEEEEESSEEDNSDDSDWDEDKYSSQKSLKKNSTKSKPPPESPLEVLMDEKDIPAAPGKPSEQQVEEATDYGLESVSLLVNGAGRKKADQAVKDRIIKLLNTGFHDQSNENEAKNAMKLAQRLMRKHNLSQALLLKEREDKNKMEQVGGSNGDEILQGGLVHVRIMNRKTQKPALFARWISHLTHPICRNFEVQSYYTARREKICTVTFYGIYTNTQLAAYAFKCATERISQMAAEYQPEQRLSWLTTTSTRSSRLSYALGIVEGISREVDDNIKREEERRLKKLEKAKAAQTKKEAYEESDDEDDGIGLDVGDNDKDGQGFSFASAQDKDDAEDASETDVVVEKNCANNGSNENGHDGEQEATSSLKPTAMSREDLELRIQELEKEEQAALVLVDHRKKVAEQILKDNNIKLSKGRKRKAIDFDHHSYRQGVEDSKEIDINQRALRDEVKTKNEVEPKKRRRS